MAVQVTFGLKTEEWVGGASTIGASDTSDPDFAFGSVIPISSYEILSPTGAWTVNNGDGTYNFYFAARGIDFDPLNLPPRSALETLAVIDEAEGGVLLLAAADNFSQGAQLGSPDSDDLASIWVWENLSSDSSFPFIDESLYVIALSLNESADSTDFNCECDEESNNENLGQLRTRMLVRLGYAAQAANPPPGMALLLDDFLRSAQRFLYGRYRALRTERFFTWTMEEGVRLYDLPDNDDTCTKELDPYRLTWVGVEDSNGVWTPLIKGIPPTFYTGVMNNGIPERYEIRQCIEVFPAPVEGYKLRIKGHFGLTSFTEDEDQTTIDSELVFLWALGSAKAHYGQPDAASVKSEANVMLGNLVAGTHQTARYVPNTWQIPPMVRPLFTGLDP